MSKTYIDEGGILITSKIVSCDDRFLSIDNISSVSLVKVAKWFRVPIYILIEAFLSGICFAGLLFGSYLAGVFLLGVLLLGFVSLYRLRNKTSRYFLLILSNSGRFHVLTTKLEKDAISNQLMERCYQSLINAVSA